MLYLSGIAAAFGIGLGLGASYNEEIKKGEAHIMHSIDNHLENSPRYKRMIEVLSVPRKEIQKYVNSWSEEEYKRHEQEFKENIERIVHESDTE